MGWRVEPINSQIRIAFFPIPVFSVCFMPVQGAGVKCIKEGVVYTAASFYFRGGGDYIPFKSWGRQRNDLLRAKGVVREWGEKIKSRAF